MRIKADLLRVKTGLAPDGSKVEPEAQPMQRALVTDFSASSQQGTALGQMKGEIVYDTTAGEMAQAMRRPCFTCKSFDKRAWKKLFLYWNDPLSPMHEREQLNGVRAAILGTNNAKIVEKSQGSDGDMDVEHALSLLGICRPLTEIHSAPVIVYPTGGCPPEVCNSTQPHGLYEPKAKEDERLGSQVFDNVMRLAQGKR
jgi:hypothetical protein